MPPRQQPVIADWIETRSYRGFLKKAFGRSKGGRFSYAEFARKAGFTARSYPRDVVLGQKRITAASLPRFTQALGLKGDLQTLFNLLVMSEEADVNHEKLSSAEIQRRLDRVRSRLRQRNTAQPVERSRKFYQSSDVLYVFASLGTLERGADLLEIAKKTALSPLTCRRILDRLCQDGAARKSITEDRYFPFDLHLVFNGIAKDDFFKTCFLNSLSAIAKQAEKTFDSEERLFLHSVFSVSRSKLPRLKKELRELLVSYADTAQEAEGDTLVNIVVGMTPRAPMRLGG